MMDDPGTYPLAITNAGVQNDGRGEPGCHRAVDLIRIHRSLRASVSLREAETVPHAAATLRNGRTAAPVRPVADADPTTIGV